MGNGYDVSNIVSVGLLQGQRPQTSLSVPFDKREPVDSYPRVLLATCREDEGLKQHLSHPALLRGVSPVSPVVEGTAFHVPASSASPVLSASLARVPTGVMGSLGIGAHASLWVLWLARPGVSWFRDGSPKGNGVSSNLKTSYARCAPGPLETFQ